MPKQKMEKVSFVATKVLNKPIQIHFFDKAGNRITFNGIRTYEKKIKCDYFHSLLKKCLSNQQQN